ncbi:helicase HerA-like domain-containing protein [Glutamicibacter sp. JC586]|uniref:helicase HerA-like domain-containing protein n=1 Tax=Glutamicibacter sp. JC586 TaxID=2590552 RepID=UPI00135B462D|nr:helicase HerA-like domain-containing protein [Glutamicibacter sp. JC586]
MTQDTNALLTSLVEGYNFTSDSLDLGVALIDGKVEPTAPIRLPLKMLNRHGLVAGATGTGKTVTLQLMAEQLSKAGVPVFLADIKGDLSGLAQEAVASEKLTARLAEQGKEFEPRANPVEFLSLGEGTHGTPVRASVDAFGPILLARVLELNETQEECLQLIFHYADSNKLPLDDLSDVKSVISYLLSDQGAEALKNLGGVSSATASVILRGITIMQSQGLDQFFGQPEFDTSDFLQVREDGSGVINVLELPSVNSQPMLFSTFLMWLLADLFEDLPEAGDLDKPKLVFFLDEAHLLFKDATKAFTDSIINTVRLIRSKGVGLFFITQSPTDLPDEVLGQLGNRIQHAVRVFTAKDQSALKKIIQTFPTNGVDLQEALTQAGVGEAVITVLGEKGAPTPVAWTKMSSPGSNIGPASPEVLDANLKASPLAARYAAAVDRESAREMLDAKAAPPAATPESAPEQAPAEQHEQSAPRQQRAPKAEQNPMMDMAVDAATMIGRELIHGMFGNRKRRRRW